jgi:hypothetical protein
VKSYGYLFVTVSKFSLKIEFWELGDEHIKAFDTVTVDLTRHVVT